MPETVTTKLPGSTPAVDLETKPTSNEGVAAVAVSKEAGGEPKNDDHDEDEPLTLPADTLAHLQAFLTERREREERFQALASQAEREHAARTSDTAGPDSPDANVVSTIPTTAEAPNISIDLFEEDWQMSQFWYDQDTQRALAEEVSFADFGFRTTPSTETAPSSSDPEPINVAIVSAPSAFVQLLSLQRQGVIPPHIRPTLLEFDSRFSILCPPPSSTNPNPPKFVQYDFNHPLQLPPSLAGSFDSILVDPPFLSAECQANAAVTVRWLLKKAPEGVSEAELRRGVGRRLILCTGETVGSLVERYYGKEGLKETTWVVKHQRGLSNPFGCFATYEGKRWEWLSSAKDAKA